MGMTAGVGLVEIYDLDPGSRLEAGQYEHARVCQHR